MGKQSLIYPGQWNTFSNKKKILITQNDMDESQTIMLSERSLTQKIIYCMIPFILNSGKDKNQSNRKQISDCQGPGTGGREQTAKGHREDFGVTNFCAMIFFVMVATQLYTPVKTHQIV